MNDFNLFKPGDKVLDSDGNKHVVEAQLGYQVWVKGESLWYDCRQLTRLEKK